MKTIAFAGSNSKYSINHQLVTYVASLVKNTEVIKLTDYKIPMYGIDLEEANGIPEAVKSLDNKLGEADQFIISVAEHNGNMTAFLKSNLDWLSRNNRDFLKDKKIVLISTSPGGRGGASALEATQKILPYFGGKIVSTLSIGRFNDVFSDGELTDIEQKNT
ncbi:MAG: NAD(P)H-dependent oxidoreductase [Saprospiraceae bacterium]